MVIELVARSCGSLRCLENQCNTEDLCIFLKPQLVLYNTVVLFPNIFESSYLQVKSYTGKTIVTDIPNHR